MTSDQPGKVNPHEPGLYEIRLQAHLPPSRSVDFPGMTIFYEPDGITVLRGFVPDQSALHGLLNRIRDLNIPLLSVNFISAGEDER